MPKLNMHVKRESLCVGCHTSFQHHLFTKMYVNLPVAAFAAAASDHYYRKPYCILVGWHGDWTKMFFFFKFQLIFQTDIIYIEYSYVVWNTSCRSIGLPNQIPCIHQRWLHCDARR